jgi:hypothetical protein
MRKIKYARVYKPSFFKLDQEEDEMMISTEQRRRRGQSKKNNFMHIALYFITPVCTCEIIRTFKEEDVKAAYWQKNCLKCSFLN